MDPRPAAVSRGSFSARGRGVAAPGPPGREHWSGVPFQTLEVLGAQDGAQRPVSRCPLDDGSANDHSSVNAMLCFSADETALVGSRQPVGDQSFNSSQSSWHTRIFLATQRRPLSPRGHALRARSAARSIRGACFGQKDVFPPGLLEFARRADGSETRVGCAGIVASAPSI